MFRYFNKILKTSRKAMSAKSGQVAVILILVVAAALIFYAISLNLGRISQTKVMTTVAADTAASTMASYMASFGQSVFMTSLGGKRKICGWTGIVAAIFAVIVAIIAVILAAPTGGASLALLALVLAVVALVMQIVVIQPGLTSAWNDIIWHSMEMKDAFVEQGVQTALSGAATDRVLVPDLDDSDGDRLWGIDGGGQPLDEVSRFGIYYTQRRLNTIPIPVAGSVQDFLNDLEDFLTEGTDAWGLIDDMGPVCDPFSANSECNPCCIPSAYWTEEMGCAANVCVPSEFDPCVYTPDPDTVDDVRTQCKNNSPYGVNYPWVYDEYRGNPTNAFVSFQEQLGRDDEHKEFRKNPVDNLLTPVYDGPNGIQTPLPGDGFKLEDTTSFHAADDRTGVFGFFYKIADWGIDLRDSDPTVLDPSTDPDYCYWHDDTYEPSPLCAGIPLPQELASAKTINFPLPVAPATLQQNTTWYVDGNNDAINPGEPPLWVDKVRLPDPADLVIPWAPGIGKIEADIDKCAQNASGDPASGFWKRGGDRFCTNFPAGSAEGWPYWGECPKYGTCPEVVDIDPETGIEEIVDPGCACGDPSAMSAENWPDDLLDDLVYGLNFFADWAQEILRSGETPEGANQLAKEFKNWYPEAAQWIEPGQSNVPRPVNDPACTATSCCFVCAAEDGALYKWHKAILDMRDRLQAWRDTSFAGSDCRLVWCVPPDLTTESPPYSSCTASFPTPPPAAEEATFDSDFIGTYLPCIAGCSGNPVCEDACSYGSGNGIRGDMEDIVACINWNANDTVTYPNAATSSDPATTQATGNADKFKACIDECNAGGLGVAEKCADLPRSLVPDVDTRLPNQSDLAGLQGCLNSCSNGSCQGMSPAYFSNDPATFDQAIDCPLVPGNIWYDEIVAALQDVCDPGGWLGGIIQSEPEARNQVAKFRQRYNYLSGRLNELNGIIAVLDEAWQKFNGFLTCADGPDADTDPDGAACRLIKARIDLDRKETGLPYHAIYGWQDAPRPGDPPGSGRWHIARADARIPEKCDRACGKSQLVNSDPGWPYVKTYTKNWGTKRCYELRGTTGVVKARVTRFDETSAFSTLLFPNAVEIWKPTFGRGDRPQTANPDNIEGACLSSMVPNPGDADAYLGSYYYGAFILNKRVDDAAYLACLAACLGNPVCEAACTPGNWRCWDLANELLSRGVTSEACAQYYFHDGTPKGMDFMFVPCQDF